MLRRTLPVVAAVALAACSGGREVPPETPAEQEVPSLAASENGAPGENTATASAENAIPDRFIGVWDYIRGTCDPASDMRLEIEEDEFGFYESTGKVTNVQTEGAAVIVDLDMAGEGETWTQSLRLVLTDDGTRLLVTEPQSASDKDDYPRRRCPA